MTTVIHKYKLEPSTISHIEIPSDNKILSTGFQGNDIYIWAMVDPDTPKIEKTIYTFATGYDDLENFVDPKRLNSIGTAMTEGLVFHVFE